MCKASEKQSKKPEHKTKNKNRKRRADYLEHNPQPLRAKQARIAHCTYHGGPAMRTLRTYCDWCWRWDSCNIPHCIGQALCQRCQTQLWIHGLFNNGDLSEMRPPWQPDARARRATQLSRAGIPATLATKIAEFEISQWEP